MNRLFRTIIFVVLLFGIQGCFLVKVPVKAAKITVKAATTPVKVIAGKKKVHKKSNKKQVVETVKKTSKQDLK